MKILAEYVWIDALGETRSKTRVIEIPISTLYSRSSHLLNISDVSLIDNIALDDFPVWCFDGSSCGMANGKDSDVVLKPCSFFKDPFRRYHTSYLVLCDTYNVDGSPHVTNNRYEYVKVNNRCKDQEPWFGIEQEYFLYQLDKNCEKPYGWVDNNHPSHKFPSQEHPEVPSAPSYCGVGADRVCIRKVIEKHLEYCLYANVKICGINLEVVCSQAEFQIGICNANEIGDHLWIARYILSRVAEEYGMHIDWKPKPLESFNGSGAHTNFSTKEMRKENGLNHIIEACKKMEPKEMIELHLQAYGNEDNKLRLTGKHETASWEKFTYGFSDRSASIRIPYTTHNAKCGYAEDRRPSSNADPYKVVSRILKTICLDEK
jgi:glutamine synthetase